jgi:alpha-1,2-mannosyltransferase
MRADWQLAFICLAPAGLLLWPVRYDLKLGQIDIVLVLMIVTDLTIGLSWRNTRLPTGVLVGLAAAIKLTPLVFVPFLLLTRQWRAARNAMFTFTAATGLMMLVTPGPSWHYFTKYAFDVRRIGDSSITNNQTLRAAIGRAGLAPPHVVVDLLIVVVLCTGLAIAGLAFRRSSVLLGVLVCAATGLLVSPISWEHHYVWCVPLLVWLVVGVNRPRRGAVWAVIAAIVFMGIPPGQGQDLTVLWFVRENPYVLAALAFIALVGAMLWSRRTSPINADSALVPRTRGEDGSAHDMPNQRRRRLAPNSTFKAPISSDASVKVPTGVGPERKSPSKRATLGPPNSM